MCSLFRSLTILRRRGTPPPNTSGFRFDIAETEPRCATLWFIVLRFHLFMAPVEAVTHPKEIFDQKNDHVQFITESGAAQWRAAFTKHNNDQKMSVCHFRPKR